MKGESLIELIIAVGIFSIAVAGLSFFVLNSYISGRLASEMTKANFLTEEGIEATRSIRDNSWDDLVAGNHGLAILGNNWIFQGTEENINNQLKEGTRIITVENIGPNRKKITSEVNWQFNKGRDEEVKIVTYLTNWQKIPIGYCAGNCSPCENFENRKSCVAQNGCRWVARFRICTGICTSCDTFIDQPSCEAQSGCYWAWE